MKILVAYASYGEGHRRAALALDGFFEAKCADLLDFCAPWFKRLTTQAYLRMTRGKGAAWHLLFALSRSAPARKIFDFFFRVIFYRFSGYLRREKPDFLVVTHPFVLAFADIIRKKFSCQIAVVITDIKVHPWWIYPAADYHHRPTSRANGHSS